MPVLSFLKKGPELLVCSVQINKAPLPCRLYSLKFQLR